MNQEHTDFESWKAAGISAGYAGPFRLQGFNRWHFTLMGETVGVWSTGRGSIGNVTLSKQSG
jgi:hypothetical protein